MTLHSTQDIDIVYLFCHDESVRTASVSTFKYKKLDSIWTLATELATTRLMWPLRLELRLLLSLWSLLYFQTAF